MKKFYNHLIAYTFFLFLFTGCGMLVNNEEELMLKNEIQYKCNSIIASKQLAICSMMKRNDPETSFCTSNSVYDKMSDTKIKKEIKALEKEYIDCVKTEEDQSKWLPF